MRYFFILGKNPTLSLAELLSVLTQEKQNFSLLATQAEFAIFDFEKSLDAAALMRRLGGTIKIGQIIGEIGKLELSARGGSASGGKNQNDNEKFKIIENIYYETIILQHHRRANFGFSLYPATNYKLQTTNYFKPMALSLKARLKEQGLGSRWVTSKEPILSSVVVQKNHLLDQGAEFVLLNKTSPLSPPFKGGEGGGALLGRTLAVQPFEEYGLREFGKPSRPIEQGILPVKLARMMINLAALPKEGTILDPFCGSGTILGEAVAMGYQNIIGSDISKEAVQEAQKNIKWLLSPSRQGKQNPNIKIIPCNVCKLSTTPIHADAIVTEPYLGPIKFNYLSTQQFNNSIHELASLYLAAFAEFTKILKPNGRVVFIFPTFIPPSPRRFSQSAGKNNGPLIKTSELVTPHLAVLGFSPVPLIRPATYSALYSRPGQQVGREIMIFTFKPLAKEQ